MDAAWSHIVGIVGGSCAGKTWLAEKLQTALESKGVRAARLSLDDFYRDRSGLSPARRARLNFDHPRAIDWKRVDQVVDRIARGEAASVPRYDFSTHGRLGQEFELSPAPVVIMEGLWLFRRASLRNRLCLRIFIRSSSELCLERRLQRDTGERGRTREQVLDQLDRFTLPMFERFVAPQERWADLVLEAPVAEREVERLVEKVETNILNMAVGI